MSETKKKENKTSIYKGKLETEEVNGLAKINERIAEAMAAKSITSYEALNQIIADKRGFSPQKSFYTKLQEAPEDKDGEGYHNMTIKNLYILADALGVSTDYILGRTSIKTPIDKYKNGSLGLSDTSLKKLREIHYDAKHYDSKMIKSSSYHYRNPYSKALDALNWIIEHTDINENEIDNYHYDFLTTMYHLVMLFFDEKMGTTPEAVFRNILDSTTEDKEEYERLMYEYNNVEMDIDDKIEVRKKLIEARQTLICDRDMNNATRKVIQDTLDGIAVMTDPATGDEVKIRVNSPYESFMKDLQHIIAEWRAEYKETYEKRIKQKKRAYDKFAKEYIKQNTESVNLEDDIDEDDIEPSYLPLYMRKMSSGEQKLYFLLLYVENAELGYISIDTKGLVSFANTDHPQFMELIKKAEEDKTGLYITKTGEIMYSEDKAMPPTERAKMLFERHNLPTILEEWMTKIRGKMVYNSYFDEYNYFEYRSQKEADEIIAKAEEAGVSYSVDGDILTVWKNEKPAT